MPSIYVDRPLMDVIDDVADQLKREAAEELDGEEPYVSDREALMEMFDSEARERVKRARERRDAR